MTLEDLRGQFKAQNGYARTGEILSAGIHFSQLKAWENAGDIRRMKQGLYSLADTQGSGTELAEICRMVPSGVLCLLSAASFHQLGTYVPWEHHVAIERSRKVVLPDYPPIHLYFWDKRFLSFGVKELETESGILKVTDLDRTLCDIVKYRNKIGKDTMAELIQAYIRRPERQISRLLLYAKQLRVETQLRTYLEVVL